MKKLLLIIFLLFASDVFLSASLNIVNSYDSKRMELFNRIITLTAKDLNLDTAYLRININRNRFNPMGTSEMGTTIYADSIYYIFLNNNLDKGLLIRVFIHELVHVSQIQQKKLIIMSGNVWFNGTVCAENELNYKRKYEEEAKIKTNELIKKYFK